MYVLHFAPDNASLIVRLALEEMGLSYRTALVDRAVRAQDGGTYRAVNPTGLIPALETPQGVVFETGAILLWLGEVHGRMAPRPGSPERGAFLKWLFFTSNTLHADARLLFYPDRHAGSEAGTPGFRRATEARILRHLGLLDALAAERPAWFLPGEPSVMTYYVSCLMRWIQLYPVDRKGWLDLSLFPNLKAIAEAMQDRPAARNCALAEGLGVTIFTNPDLARPPVGSAT